MYRVWIIDGVFGDFAGNGAQAVCFDETDIADIYPLVSLALKNGYQVGIEEINEDNEEGNEE